MIAGEARSTGADRLLRLLLVLVLLATATAGCASGEDGDGATAEAEPTTKVASGTLRIEGTVTDVAIQPLGGVSVSLLPAGHLATTGPEGRYAFEGVTAGKYLLRFQRDDFLPAARTVVAENGTARLDIRLLDAPSTDPFVERFNVTGFVECAAGTPGHGQEAPGGDGIASSCVAVLPNFGDVDNPTNERIVVPFETRPNLTALRVTMQWAGELPGNAIEMTLLLEQSGSQGETGYEHTRASGPSPVVLDLDAAALEALRLGSGASLQTRTFPGSSASPAFAVQQDFELAFELAYFGASL